MIQTEKDWQFFRGWSTDDDHLANSPNCYRVTQNGVATPQGYALGHLGLSENS